MKCSVDYTYSSFDLRSFHGSDFGFTGWFGMIRTPTSHARNRIVESLKDLYFSGIRQLSGGFCSCPRVSYMLAVGPPTHHMASFSSTPVLHKEPATASCDVQQHVHLFCTKSTCTRTTITQADIRKTTHSLELGRKSILVSQPYQHHSTKAHMRPQSSSSEPHCPVYQRL